MVRRPDTVVDGPYVCDNGPFLSSPVGRSTRPIARSTARIPPLACARSFVADRDSSSVPPLDPHASATRDGRAETPRARRASHHSRARRRGCVSFESMRCDARERGKGGRGVGARVRASRRVAFVVVARGRGRRRWMITRARARVDDLAG